MQETLAAACIMALRWDRKSPFISPMCGSGTPAIEAALQKSGVNYEQILGEGMFHCYPVFPIVKEGREGWRQMVERMIRWRDET